MAFQDPRMNRELRCRCKALLAIERIPGDYEIRRRGQVIAIVREGAIACTACSRSVSIRRQHRDTVDGVSTPPGRESHEVGGRQ